uniref:Tellurium resistance protein TerD n=1 Tax=Klebsiella pneumoniae TaxID=573 RepID=A0A8B0SVD3_KLEPN|nr:Tellurium resistance protein TerD [Klebsiella pneumoniae]
MSVSLSKGGNVSLSKNRAKHEKNVWLALAGMHVLRTVRTLTSMLPHFCWQPMARFVAMQISFFYNNLKSADGSVTHTGDNRTGEGDGDDESLKNQTGRGTRGCRQKLFFVVTIHDAQARRQSFGQVSGAFIRLVNDDNQTEVARYDLTEDASTETAMLFGELYRHNGEWKFRAVGRGYAGGLASVCAQYGINAS